MKKKIILGFAAVAMLASCGGEQAAPAASTTPETSNETTNEPVTEAPTNIDATVYSVTKDSSSVINWTGSALAKSHFGTVDYSGDLKVSEGKLVGGEIVIDMTTIDSKDQEGEGKEKLDGHLKNADFFNVDSFPTAKLEIKGFDGTNLSGSLTIKDVTKDISFPASVNVSENEVSGTAEFTINRTDYGVVYGSGNFFDLAKDKIISDDIEFKVSIKAVK